MGFKPGKKQVKEDDSSKDSGEEEMFDSDFDKLIEDLNRGSWEAAETLGELRDKRAVAPLIKVLEGGMNDARFFCSKSIG